MSDNAVSVPDSPPAVTIDGPSAELRIPFGTTLVFMGRAFDAEDFGLPETTLRWESDRDGSLGTGAELTIDTLTIGTHEVSLSATDSGRNESIATVFVTIVEGPGPVVRDASIERELLVLLGVEVADEDDDGVELWLIIAGASAAVILILAVMFLLLRRRTRGAG